MRRKNTKRAILSFACSARQETMPHAWGSERNGRSAREPKRFKARALYEASDRRAEKSKAAHTRCRKPDRRNRSVTFPCRLKWDTQCRRLVSFTGEHWSLTMLREKLVKIGANQGRRSRTLRHLPTGGGRRFQAPCSLISCASLTAGGRRRCHHDGSPSGRILITRQHSCVR